MSKQTNGVFEVVPGAARTKMNEIGMDFNRLPITLHPWTITTVSEGE